LNFLEAHAYHQPSTSSNGHPSSTCSKPKAGGIAAVDAMGEQLHSIVNVTIHLPAGHPGFFWDLCGRIDQMVVPSSQVQIPLRIYCTITIRTKPTACNFSSGSIQLAG
jgi:hypothetical protein